jgi:hypothetical protein
MAGMAVRKNGVASLARAQPCAGHGGAFIKT